MKIPVKTLSYPTLVLTLGACLLARADDWPQWRGPNRDGISKEKGWLVNWPQDGLKTLWKAQVGIGYATMSVQSGKVFTMGNTDEKDSVYCLSAEDGKVLWTHTYDCSSKDPNGFPGPRCTPTADGKLVYSLSRNGHLFCLDVESGKPVWSKDLVKDYEAKIPTWGFSESPLVEGNALLVLVGGTGKSLVAFDKTTGKELWRAGDDAAAYSSIFPFDDKGKRTLAVLSAAGVAGRSAADGKELWRYPWKTSYDVNAATPVVSGSKVFISSGYNTGCALVDFASGQATEVWKNKKMRNHVATCILYKEHLYGFDEGKLKCLEWATGEEKWAEGSFGKGSLMMADGKFIVYSDKGRVAVVEPDPAGFKQISSYQALGGNNTWSQPVLANGRLLVRSLGDLVCLDLRGK